MFRTAFLFAIVAFNNQVSHSLACTTFVLNANGALVYGRNLDYGYEYGLIVVNKRNVQKTAFAPDKLDQADQLAQWTSKYGSITVSSIGREFPCSGINEAGLTISEMTLSESRYSDSDDRPAVNVLQWIQYQLDNFASVEEVLASITRLRVIPLSDRGHHYLVCDSSGDVATIEFLNGQIVARRRESLKPAVLTNSTCDSSFDFLKGHVGFGGNVPIPQGRASLDRFVRAASLVSDSALNGEPVDRAFQILSDVAQGNATKWSLVFDITFKRLYFRTLSRPSIKFIDLSALDYRCDTPMKLLDINHPGQGDVTQMLSNYTDEAHRRFFLTMAHENKEVQKSGDPSQVVELYSNYLGTLECQRTTNEPPKQTSPALRASPSSP